MYKIRYLPLALDDLKDIVRYISYELESPQAAERLLAKIDKEVKKIGDNPFQCHLYNSTEKLKYEYRILNIDNYSLLAIFPNR
jgi:plasmid stabilization system protein ParE